MRDVVSEYGWNTQTVLVDSGWANVVGCRCGDDDAHEKSLTGRSIKIFECEAAGFVLGCPGITHKNLDDLGNVGGYLAQVQMALWVGVSVATG